ncbi:MAG: hypothetical protein ISR51_05300 [Rhodospirillales bacterium]|nr:hypothetical protein [Alphaproteobacteria bacterium]MBL6948075.1 hypothetical protein [Rhodospirillales bacterium]
MGLFGKSKKKMPPPGPPMDVHWVTSPKGQFYNFLNLEPMDHDLSGKTGVYVIWLGGHWPEWLFIGRTDDLADTLQELQSDRAILRYEREGHIYATWAEIKPQFQAGVVQYLSQVIPPAIPNPNPPDEDEPPIAVFPPGIAPPPPI